mmetsp:Transcript_110802/g.196305  ORF Transcript_110802/g.196305 Transcript_110802/m.196305 type:complete len:203 (+) Transcript_110802:974-1582(+)
MSIVLASRIYWHCPLLSRHKAKETVHCCLGRENPEAKVPCAAQQLERHVARFQEGSELVRLACIPIPVQPLETRVGIREAPLIEIPNKPNPLALVPFWLIQVFHVRSCFRRSPRCKRQCGAILSGSDKHDLNLLTKSAWQELQCTPSMLDYLQYEIVIIQKLCARILHGAWVARHRCENQIWVLRAAGAEFAQLQAILREDC